jgi:hypothetical protein
VAAEADRCAGCGLEIAGGTAGCQALFERLVGRDFTEVAYFTVHRMMVDVYALQHAERTCKSAKSFAAHLCGLCDLLERGASRAIGSDPLRAWLDGPTELERPQPPDFRGALTIAEVAAAEGPTEHARRVEAWARSTWEAYAPLHELAREWLDRAFAARRGLRH